MKQLLTIDIEEWYRNDFPGNDQKQWRNFDDRLELEIPYLLSLLQQHHQIGTFFILGIVAQNHPKLIYTISRAGHEVASHGWEHRRVTDLTRREFKDDVKKSAVILKKITGRPVRGFRAPYWSILHNYPVWYYDVLKELGFSYSSSLLPTSLPFYGSRMGLPVAHKVTSMHGLLWEIPPTTYEFLSFRIPVASGVFLRVLPWWVTKYTTNQIVRNKNQIMAVVHNWELDPYQPQMPWSLFFKLGHYIGLAGCEDKFVRLLASHQFMSIAQALKT